jgi:hypothetical protein
MIELQALQPCPVCGFSLDFLPWNEGSAADEKCPCCGIQFGYDDSAGGSLIKRQEIYAQARQVWINAGMPWRSRGRKPPQNWDPLVQLARRLE